MNSNAGEMWPEKRMRFLMRRRRSNEQRKVLAGASLVTFLSMDSIGEQGVLDCSVIRDTDDVRNGYTLFFDGDVLVAKITPCFENGKGALVHGTLNGVGFGTTELHVLNPSSEIDARFLYYITVSGHFRKLGEAEMFGTAGQKRVPEDFVRDYRVRVPPLTLQRAIADYLDRETMRLDALATEKECILNLLAERRQTVITRAVTCGLSEHAAAKSTGIDWLGEIPAHWQVNRLKFVAPIRSSKLTSAPVDRVYVGLEHIESQTGRLHIYAGPSKAESVVGSFAAGDVLFGKLRPYLAKVGRPTVSGVCTTEVVALQPVGCSQDYLFYALLNASFIRWMDSLTFGSKMPRVSPEQIANSFIAVPPRVEQRAISDFLDRETAKIDVLVARVRETADRLKERRLALIAAAVTGQIAVDA